MKNNTLNVSNGLLGIFTKKQRIPFSEVIEINKKEVMRSQSGTKHTVHFSVTASLRSGKKLNIAKHIEGESAADLVETYFRNKIGMPDTGRSETRLPNHKVPHSKMARPVT